MQRGKGDMIMVIGASGFIGTYTTEQLIADENIWHVFGFGPNLLDENGQPKTEFNSKVTTSNHRCAIGYYEPGHYCFLFVQGDRKQAENTGLTLEELSRFMFNLGNSLLRAMRKYLVNICILPLF